MRRYYYHGVGDMIDEVSLDMMLLIISSGGLKTRESARGLGSSFNHVCLYRKNEDYDYKDITKSARGGWIDHCFFFIVSPDIEAEKVPVTTSMSEGTTNLVDEWRSKGDITLDKIAGIGIPFDSIRETKERFSLSWDSFDDKLSKLIAFANENGLMVENSDEENLCDRLDSMLNKKKVQRG